jgi:hypothetical protein
MIVVTTNINTVMANLISETYKAASEESIDKLLRSLAISTAGDMAYRIHTEGKKADGSPIGTYSDGYMKVRTGQFSTNKKFTKGKNKGETKPTGVFTKGKNKGQPRPKYNRTSDTKVIFSLTRQMENDFGLKENKEPIKTNTGYGVGFKNPDNTQKAEWLTETGVGRKKKVFTGVYELSDMERQKIRDIAEDFIANAFKTR